MTKNVINFSLIYLLFKAYEKCKVSIAKLYFKELTNAIQQNVIAIIQEN